MCLGCEYQAFLPHLSSMDSYLFQTALIDLSWTHISFLIPLPLLAAAFQVHAPLGQLKGPHTGLGFREPRIAEVVQCDRSWRQRSRWREGWQ